MNSSRKPHKWMSDTGCWAADAGFRRNARRNAPMMWALGVVLIGLAAGAAPGQDRLKTMPGYDRYLKAREGRLDFRSQGRLRVTWAQGGKVFGFDQDDKYFRFDIAAGKAVETADPVQPDAAPRGGRFEFRARGRQYTTATSPDGKRTAFYRDRNLWLKNAAGAGETPITRDGSAEKRIKYGTASWVYGEELEQTTAFWWSPDSKKIAFYRFDESRTPDFYLALDTLKVQDALDVEPYPKAGAPNPVADLLIYDLATGKTTRVDVRSGKPFDNGVVGHYIYDVAWSPDGKELLFNRTNRRQNVLEFCAADPETGRCRVIVRESWPASWTENHPFQRFLKDGRRFLWASERTGFRNYSLYDLSGKQLATLTDHPYDAERIVDVDEAGGELYYLARSTPDYHRFQFHRVRLDGSHDEQLTDPAFHHEIQLAPDFKHFIDTALTYDTPPVTRLVDMQGKVIAELARSQAASLAGRVERFTYPAADGKTTLYGMLSKPADFDPKRTYPVLVSIYAGPESGGEPDAFRPPSPLTEFGFLVAEFEGRGTAGRGKRFKDAMYGKLGVTEIDDEAAGVKYLDQRPYVDAAHVGIDGVSYGGYASLMCLLRYPDLFRAASCSSSVTDWRNYDSIYTERYMWLPQENQAAYDAGSAMTYAQNLHGKLLLYYGTADNNVHPNNTLQVIRALQDAGKSFEVQVGPDQEHSGVNYEHMLEFFIDNLKSGKSSG